MMERAIPYLSSLPDVCSLRHCLFFVLLFFILFFNTNEISKIYTIKGDADSVITDIIPMSSDNTPDKSSNYNPDENVLTDINEMEFGKKNTNSVVTTTNKVNGSDTAADEYSEYDDILVTNNGKTDLRLNISANAIICDEDKERSIRKQSLQQDTNWLEVKKRARLKLSATSISNTSSLLSESSEIIANHQSIFYFNQIMSDLQIPSTKINILGEFDPRKTYEYIPEYCSVNSMLSPDPPQGYSCEPHPNGTFSATFSINDDGIQTCGGFPMEAYNCLMPSRGSFKYFSRSQMKDRLGYISNISKKKTKKDDGDDKAKTCSWCRGLQRDYTIGSYSRVFGAYSAEDCKIVSPDPKFIVDKLSNNSVTVFLGDSHMRQVFRGLIATVRNQKIVIETFPSEPVKSEFMPFIRYEVGESRDDLRDGFYSDQLSLDDVQVCYTEPESGRCAVFLFVWKEYFQNQQEFVRNVLPKLRPHTVIASTVYTHEKQEVLPSSWKEAWEGLNPFPNRFFYVSFPVSNMDTNRTTQISQWIESRKESDVRFKNSIVIHRGCFHSNLFPRRGSHCSKSKWTRKISHFKTDSEKWLYYLKTLPGDFTQLTATHHTTCRAYNSYPMITKSSKVSELGIWRVSAFSDCLSYIDRAISRVILTLSIFGTQ